MKKMIGYVNYIDVEMTPNELESLFVKDFIKMRKENNLTQELLADYSNVERVKIARIESEMHSPTVKTLMEILGPIGYTIKIEKIKKK